VLQLVHFKLSKTYYIMLPNPDIMRTRSPQNPYYYANR